MADDYSDAAKSIIKAAKQVDARSDELRQFMCADEDTDVQTCDGKTVPSLRKLIANFPEDIKDDILGSRNDIDDLIEKAKDYRDSAQEAAQNAAGGEVFPTTDKGLDETSDGDAFWVYPNDDNDLDALTLFENDDGDAKKRYEQADFRRFLISQGDNWSKVNG